MKMKRTYILLTLLLLFFSDVALSALSIEGTYQGKNLYVQNPIDDEGFGYCATKVTVNGDIMPGGTGSGAFEIDFGIFRVTLQNPMLWEKKGQKKWSKKIGHSGATKSG